MAGQNSKKKNRPISNRDGITRITVGGFKSISHEQSIEIKPLTILADTNSSGKSSIMQPLLLLKQTLESNYDPGALLLNGPNLKFTSVDQLLSRASNGKFAKRFHVGITLGAETTLTTFFTRDKNKRLDVEKAVLDFGKEKYSLYLGMEQDSILPIIPEVLKQVSAELEASFKEVLEAANQDSVRPYMRFIIVRNRCFLTPAISFKDGPHFSTLPIATLPIDAEVRNKIRRIVHLPGLRGNPERTYPVTAVSSEFPGTFENYVASVIGQWQADNDNEKLEKVNRDLERLGLTGKVVAKPINDTQVELRVNRLPCSNKGGSEDMVSIADVGLGISQTLPVIVALHAANTGQLIYLEQPEIHLHPRAQSAMAEVLADAAMQGKTLVVETHSSLLLLGIQTLVAEGKLPPEMVKLHWFTLTNDGSTRIDSADLDERGAYGDWPEDFDDISLYSEDRFLNAQALAFGPASA